MSSVYVRGKIKDFIEANFATEVLIDLSGEFDDIRDLLAAYSIDGNDAWLGIQFIGHSDEPVTIGNSTQIACYREFGSFFLHVVEPAKLGVASTILSRADTLISAFRGKRLDDIIIVGTMPPNFERGAAISFEGGFTGATVIVDYSRDLNV